MTTAQLRFMFAVAAMLTACGKTTTSSNTTGSSATPNAGTNGVTTVPTNQSSDVQMAQSAYQSGDNSANGDSATANHSAGGMTFLANTGRSKTLTVSTAFSTTVHIKGCTVAVNGNDTISGDGWVIDANLIFDPNNCSHSQHTLSGSESIVATYAGPSSNPNRLLMINENIVETWADSSSTAITQLDPNTVTLTLTAAGLASNGNVALTAAISEHRVRTAADGNMMFDHNITTATGAQLYVIETYSTSLQVPTLSSRTLVSGTVGVHHNLAHYTGVHQFTNLFHDLTGSCDCPQSGTLQQTVTMDDGSGGFIRTYTFTGCGQASVTTSASTLSSVENGTATLTWTNCSD